jgi:hypothetical protein
MSYKLVQFRRGTAAEWAATNPILAAGEIGYEREIPAASEESTDTYSYSDGSFSSGAIKIGDGVTRWGDLPYLLTSLRLAVPSTALTVTAFSDVDIKNIQAGDVLRWSNGKWSNYPELTLLDGGNY